MLTMMTMGMGRLMGGAFSFMGQTASGAAAGATQGATQQGGGRAQDNVEQNIGAGVDSVRAAAESVKQDVVRNQEEITGAVSTGAWAALILMILSLAAAVVGAASGARRVVQAEPATVTSTVT
jgi:hypothetical protein